MNWTVIGRKIKERRKECKITQTELADKIGKTESSIRKYEKGLVQIPTDVFEKIAEVLETTPHSLIGAEWFDMQVGDKGLKELQRAVNSEEGMVATLEEIYGSVESKEVSNDPGLFRHYYFVGKPPNTFILGDNDIETLITATKAFIPALVDRVKDTRPEETVVQEMLDEMKALPDPEK